MKKLYCKKTVGSVNFGSRAGINYFASYCRVKRLTDDRLTDSLTDRLFDWLTD